MTTAVNSSSDNYYDAERAERYRYREMRDDISFFKKMEWIPIISEIPASIRAVFGGIQVVVGLFTWPVEWLSNDNPRYHFLITNGILNIVRACVAAIPLAGNLVLFMYDTGRI